MKLKFLFFVLFLSLPFNVSASMTGFVDSSLWLSNTEPLVGDLLKIRTVIANDSKEIFSGTIVFYDNSVKIGENNFYLPAGDTSQIVSLDWTAVLGEHKFEAEIIEDDSLNNNLKLSKIKIQENIYVDIDSDGDGLADKKEKKLGTNPLEIDTDKDGQDDFSDPAPLDNHCFDLPDTDGDKISDLVDTDIDNDGLYNWDEEKNGTSVKEYDSDGDGFSDKEDVFPLDSTKHKIVKTEKEEAVEKEENNFTKQKDEIKKIALLDVEKETAIFSSSQKTDFSKTKNVLNFQFFRDLFSFFGFLVFLISLHLMARKLWQFLKRYCQQLDQDLKIR